MTSQAQPPTERTSASAWRRTPQVVREELIALVQELAEVKGRLAKAEEQLRRNSHNSSQPSSQDKPVDKPARSKRREQSESGADSRAMPVGSER